MSDFCEIYLSDDGKTWLVTPVRDVYDRLMAGYQSVAAGFVGISDLGDIAATSVRENKAEMLAPVLVEMAQQTADMLNSISSIAGNARVVSLDAQQMQLPISLLRRTTVFVQFNGVAGFLVSPNTVVSDDLHQYRTIEPLILDNSGVGVVRCEALQDGAWAVDAGTVINVDTGSLSALTCINPEAGTPALPPESVADLRWRCFRAKRAIFSGSNATLELMLLNMGIPARLISVPDRRVIIGNADLYDQTLIAGAIYDSGILCYNLIGKQNSGTTIIKSIVNPPNSTAVRFIAALKITLKIDVEWRTGNIAFAAEKSVNSIITTRLIEYVNTMKVGTRLALSDFEFVVLDAIYEVLPRGQGTQVTSIALYNGVTLLTFDANGFCDLPDETFVETDSSQITVERLALV